MNIWIFVNIAICIWFFFAMLRDRQIIHNSVKSFSVLKEGETDHEDYMIARISSDVFILLLDYTVFLVNLIVVLIALFK